MQPWTHRRYPEPSAEHNQLDNVRCFPPYAFSTEEGALALCALSKDSSTELCSLPQDNHPMILSDMVTNSAATKSTII